MEYGSYIMNGLMAIVMWFMRSAHEDTKERIRVLEAEHKNLVRRDDFRDFKIELFQRLDRIEGLYGKPPGA